MTDHVAYDANGKPYLVNNNLIDSDSMAALVSYLRSGGLTDPQIKSKISQIEEIMMDASISKLHPTPCVRKAAEARLDELSEEDIEEILTMTDPHQLTMRASTYATRDSRDRKRIYGGWRSITHILEDASNQEYNAQDRQALAEA